VVASQLEDGGRIGARWDGNFLALVGGKNLVPIIIEFQL